MGFRLRDLLRIRPATEGGEAGGSGNEAAVEYKGYTISPSPRQEGAQWLTSGVIRKEFPDGVKEHRFIRADIHASKEDADAFSLGKAKQIIDELGDRLFEIG